MNAERWNKLIEAVEKAPEEQFEMGAFLIQDECGTVACAAGHYCLRYPESGLKLLPWSPQYTDIFDVFGIDGTRGHEALAAHFEIPAKDAEVLFYPDYGVVHADRAMVLEAYRDYRTSSTVPAWCNTTSGENFSD